MTRSKPSLVLAPLLLALSCPAWALQILDARDGETVLARISQKEVTRIAFERSRIRKVTGNTGEFVLEKDEDKGQIFIRPTSAESTKPINLFVSLRAGHGRPAVAAGRCAERHHRDPGRPRSRRFRLTRRAKWPARAHDQEPAARDGQRRAAR